MAEKSSWQSQNFSKSSGSTGPSSMNSKIAVNSAQLHSKIAKPTVQNYCNGGSVKKYADGTPGGVQDDATGVDEAVARNAASDWAANENYGDGTTADQRREMTGAAPAKMATNDEVRAAAEPTPEAKPVPTKQSFGDAFKAARAAGGADFEWNGKKYTTELATSKGVSKAPAAAPAPKTETKSVAPAAQAAPAAESKPAAKTFAEDVAERKRNVVANSMARDENYSHEGSRPAQVAKKSSGRGVIDTSNIDPVTLLPKKK
jgi:hypothetical protein